MSKAYLKGTVERLYKLQTGIRDDGKKWTRQDIVVLTDNGEEKAKIWDGDQAQIYEGATIEIHGKLEEYAGKTSVVANYLNTKGEPTGDVKVNGNAPATPEVAKTVLSGQASVSTGQGTIPFTRLMELHVHPLNGTPR
jgi:hypothetical protein